MKLTLKGKKSFIEHNGKRIPCSESDIRSFARSVSSKLGSEFWLPKGTSFVGFDGGSVTVALMMPPMRRHIRVNLNLDSKENFSDEVGFPAGCFIVTLKNNRICLSWLYAIKSNFKKTGDLYPFPAPNIYTHGAICWGEREKVLKVSSLRAIEGVLNDFFDAEFNDDLPFAHSVNGVQNSRSVLNKMKGKDFSQEWLMEKPSANIREFFGGTSERF